MFGLARFHCRYIHIKPLSYFSVTMASGAFKGPGNAMGWMTVMTVQMNGAVQQKAMITVKRFFIVIIYYVRHLI